MRPAVLALAAVVVLSACGGDDADELVVEQPRIGATPVGADAALYFGITSPVDDRLIGVDTDVAADVSLHVTGSTDGTMIEIDEFELPAGTRVLLEPFGDHIMLERVVRELQPGDEVDVILRFAEHAPVQVSADVSQLYELAWEDS